MPSPISILMISIAGISFYIGLSYLFTVRSVHHHREPLLFALLCLCAGLYFMTTLYGYKSISREILILATRWEEILSLVMVVLILWFLADYSNWKPHAFLIGFTSIVIVLIVITFFLPFGITWESVAATVIKKTPWNETINVITGKVSPWGYVSYAVYATLIIYSVMAAARLYMLKNFKCANYLIVPLLLAIICFFNDIFLNSNKINSFYMVPYVYMAIILFIGNNLETNRLRALSNYQTLFDAINDAVTVHDAFTGNMLDANSAASRMFGCSRQELLSGELSQTLLTPTFVSDQTKKYILAAYQDEPLLIEKLIKRRSDGIEFWAEMALRTEVLDGKPVILAVTRNVDARKKVEEELEKTQRLESLGIVAGGIAHDFNNLLGGIYGYINVIRQQSMNDEINEYLNATLGTLERARGLTQQLLTFSKGGTPELKTSPIREFIIKTVQFALSGSSISCTFSLPDDLLPCRYDANQLAQVIENITINADQATSLLGGQITVSAKNVVLNEEEHSSLESGRYVQIAITDNGTGIPRDIANKIFDPFFTTKENGCGLGLATSFSIIKRHKGAIEVSSEPGKGSTFILFIPTSSETVLETEQLSTPIKKITGTILLMDDEIPIRNAVALMLKMNGFSVVQVSDGSEALEKYNQYLNSESPFIAIILDLTIPGKMGGRETVEKIRKKDDTIPVFVYSGYAEDPIIAHPEDYGFTDSIKKPFVAEELMKMMMRYL